MLPVKTGARASPAIFSRVAKVALQTLRDIAVAVVLLLLGVHWNYGSDYNGR